MSFTVEVTSKPRGPIKGQYALEFNDAALFLRKKGHSDAIKIPVGTAAECDKKATVRVDQDGTELALRVLGIALNNQRLAEDLAGYLSGEREAPDVANYRIPGYLVGMAMLPIAIPIMTLGGAIPAGIAGGMVFGCLGIAKNDKLSPTRRAIYILAISGVGIVAAIALVVAVAIARSGMGT